MRNDPRTRHRAALARQALNRDAESFLPPRYYEVLRRRANGETLKQIAADLQPGYPPYTRERIRQIENSAHNHVEAVWISNSRQEQWHPRLHHVPYLRFVLNAMLEQLRQPTHG